ncbi:MAG: hypothetical protein ACPLXS_03060, partial [Candidatus Micrarchaeales archaeon]
SPINQEIKTREFPILKPMIKESLIIFFKKKEMTKVIPYKHRATKDIKLKWLSKLFFLIIFTIIIEEKKGTKNMIIPKIKE